MRNFGVHSWVRTKHWIIVIVIVLLLAGAVAAPKVAKVVTTLSEKGRIDALEPGTRAAYLKFVARMESLGFGVRTAETVRSQARQDSLGGQSGNEFSWHQLGRAIDMYPIINGKVDVDGKDLGVYRIFHKEAEKLGFRSLAFNPDGSKRLITNRNGQKIWDGGHIEFRGPYATLAAARAAEEKKAGIA